MFTVYLIESADSYDRVSHKGFSFAHLRDQSIPEYGFEGPRKLGCDLSTVKPEKMAFLLGFETLAGERGRSAELGGFGQEDAAASCSRGGGREVKVAIARCSQFYAALALWAAFITFYSSNSGEQIS